jgi:hypothetical protein
MNLRRIAAVAALGIAFVAGRIIYAQVCGESDASRHWTPASIGAPVAPGVGTNYYVDKNNGSDSNSGLSPALAFKTIGKNSSHSRCSCLRSN